MSMLNKKWAIENSDNLIRKVEILNSAQVIYTAATAHEPD
jgi:hypothetical protein